MVPCPPAARDRQVFLDVVESVNLLVNSNGSVVRSEVVGALKMRAYLSGMVSGARLKRPRERRQERGNCLQSGVTC